jgi:hypothetical protein
MKTKPINADRTTTLVAHKADIQYIVNGSIKTTTSLAIDASGAISGREFIINGSVSTDTGTAMTLGDALLADSNSYIKIGDVGTFSSGGRGVIAASGGVTFENVGTFTTGSTGVILRGDGNVFKNVSSEFGPGKMTASTGSVLVSYGDGDNIENTGAGLMNAKDDVIVSHGARTNIANNGTGQINSNAGSGIVATGSRDVIFNVGSISALDDAIVSTGSRTKITNDGNISSNSGSGIVSRGNLSSVINTATISCSSDGIVSTGDGTKIANTATIVSWTGVGIRSTGDSATISNSTTVNAKTIGILSTGDDAVIRNLGSVGADKVGIRIIGDDASVITTAHVTAAIALSISGSGTKVTIDNEITGTAKSHATIEVDAAGVTTIINRAAVNASLSGVVIDAGRGSEHIVNTGSLYGDVKLGGGNDVFSALKGEVSGKVYGGNGNDTYIVGIPLEIREKANGGTDTVESKFTYTLGANLENLTLIGKGTMDATGNRLANRIEGNAGNNHLTGGGGNDVFVFSTGSHRDIITDFQDHHDKIDLSHFDGISKFSDLAGKIVQSGDDVIINFNSTDHLTLDNVHKSHLSAADFVF